MNSAIIRIMKNNFLNVLTVFSFVFLSLFSVGQISYAANTTHYECGGPGSYAPAASGTCVRAPGDGSQDATCGGGCVGLPAGAQGAGGPAGGTAGGGATGGTAVTLPSNLSTPAACLVGTGSKSQTCSVSVSNLSSNGSANPNACKQLASSSLSSNLQQGVTGTAPSNGGGAPITTTYNPNLYATPAATAMLAQCLGGSVVLTSGQASNSPITIPAQLQIVYPNGVTENAGYLINRLIYGYNGNVSAWQNAVVNPELNGAVTPIAQTAVTNPTASSVTAATLGTGTGGTTGSGSTNSSINNFLQSVNNITGNNTSTNSSDTAVNKFLQSNLNMINWLNTGAYVNSATNPNGIPASSNTATPPPATTTNPPPTTTSIPAYNFTTNLQQGDSGAGVTALTQILTSQGFLSAPQNTFDSTVFNAVVAFQEKHADQILTPLGLTAGTGFVGPSTRAYLNSTDGADTTSGTDIATANLFRYLKIFINNRPGWPGIREVEIYDPNGNKINLSGATATASIGDTPKAAIDGDQGSMWNTEAAFGSGCQRVTQTGCNPADTRSAFLTIDLGKITSVGRIRYLPFDILPDQTMLVDNTENNIIAVSDGGKTFNSIAEFDSSKQDPFFNGIWLEYPEPVRTYSGNPVASFTADGFSDGKSANITVHPGDGIIFHWAAQNADKVYFTTNNMLNDEGTTAGCQPYTFPAPDGNTITTYGDQLSGSLYWEDYHDCNLGSTFSITYTAAQRTGGKSTSVTITITVANPPTYKYSIPALDFYGGMSDAGYSLTGTVFHILSDNPNILRTNYNIGASRSAVSGNYYSFPVLSADTPPGLSMTFGQVNVLSFSSYNGNAPVTITSSTLTDGMYKIRIYGNRGQSDQTYVDAPLYVGSNAPLPVYKLVAGYTVGPTKVF